VTDKPLYDVNETVLVYANLTLGYSPVQDGLVALEVDDPRNQIIVVRTLSTGIPPTNQTIEIVDVIPCGGPPDYVPRSWFYNGTKAYFNVTVKNNDSESRNAVVAINIYDANFTPLGTLMLGVIVAANDTLYFIKWFIIPDTASLGDAQVYVSALTGLPRNGGTAYCPEEPATFEIRESGGAGATASLPQNLGSSSEGPYNLTFKLPPDAGVGIYRVYASASYHELSTTGRTAFGIGTILVPDHYSTIQGAVNAADPTNNSILVKPETYSEHVTINKPLTLVGRDSSRTIIDGDGTGTVVTVASDNVRISLFKIQNSGSSFPDSGIALESYSGNTISENTISKNYYGMNVHSSDNNLIFDNTLSSNNYGIYLNRSSGNTLTDNNMVCNKYNFGVFGDSISDFTHVIGTSNTVNGKPVIYWTNRNGLEVPSNAGFVAVVNSTDIVVRGLYLGKNVQGILFAFTTDSVIERVNTVSNEYGIYMAYSYSNTIIGSGVSNNAVGIFLRNSNGNTVYHNNFVDNIDQVERHQSSNTWDDGGLWLCPSCGQPQPKGNYWIDYAGLDVGTPTQAHNCPGDGVGDTLTPHLGVDKYPLMYHWTIVHDVAITTVTYATPYNAPHVYAWPDWTVTVTVTVRNKGDSIETFDVSAYANATFIESQTVTLPVTVSTTVVFTWNMNENMAKGSYTISAQASVVPGEKAIHETDNTYSDGTLLVNGIGDANGDRKVTITDIVIVALAFGTRPGDSEWNPIADLNVDGKVSITDIVLAAIRFGETYP